MLETIVSSAAARGPLPAAPFGGPQREREPASAGAAPPPVPKPPALVLRHDMALWLTRMLDEIDYGMLLVDADAQVRYSNHAARLELDGARTRCGWRRRWAHGAAPTSRRWPTPWPPRSAAGAGC